MILGMGPRFEPSPISCLPVTWSNVLAGSLLGSAIQGSVDWVLITAIIFAASMLHLAERPLIILRSKVELKKILGLTIAGGLLLAGGMSIAWSIRLEAGVTATLIATILLLDLWNRRRGLSAILAFSLRRVLLYPLGFTATLPLSISGLTGGGGGEFLIASIMLSVLFIHLTATGLVAWGRFDPTVPTCPSCGHFVLEDQTSCPECGSPCGPEVRAGQVVVARGFYRGMPGRVAFVLLLPFLGAASLSAVLLTAGPGRHQPLAMFMLMVSLATLLILGSHLFLTIRRLADIPELLRRYVARSLAALALFDAGLIMYQLDSNATLGAAICVAAFILTMAMNHGFSRDRLGAVRED